MDNPNNDMEAFEDINIPPLPSAFQIVFRCRNCDYVWRLELDLPAPLTNFYKQNCKCYHCQNISIEMDIIPKGKE